MSPSKLARNLDPLIDLEGHVEDVTVRGDLPVSYCEMIRGMMLEGVKPTPPIKKKQTEEASKAKSRARNQEAGHGGSRAF